MSRAKETDPDLWAPSDPPQPLLSDTAVRTLCRTMVVLAVLIVFSQALFLAPGTVLWGVGMFFKGIAWGLGILVFLLILGAIAC